MTRDDKRPRQPRMTDGEREKARRAKRRKQRQDDHRLKTAADPEKLAEERELRASMGSINIFPALKDGDFQED